MFVLGFLLLGQETPPAPPVAPTPGEVQQLIDLIYQHKWLAFSALTIGLVVRLLKSDTKIPIDIPPKYRFWLALGLGFVSAGLDKVVTGTPWKQALTEGLVSAALAVIGHNAFINSIRGGKELVIPGLIKPGVPPGPGKPPSLSPPPMTEEEKKAEDKKEDDKPTEPVLPAEDKKDDSI